MKIKLLYTKIPLQILIKPQSQKVINSQFALNRFPVIIQEDIFRFLPRILLKYNSMSEYNGTKLMIDAYRVIKYKGRNGEDCELRPSDEQLKIITSEMR